MTQKICFDCFHKLFPDKPIRKITLGRQCVVCKAQTDRTEQMVPVEEEDIRPFIVLGAVTLWDTIERQPHARSLYDDDGRRHIVHGPKALAGSRAVIEQLWVAAVTTVLAPYAAALRDTLATRWGIPVTVGEPAYTAEWEGKQSCDALCAEFRVGGGRRGVRPSASTGSAVSAGSAAAAERTVHTGVGRTARPGPEEWAALAALRSPGPHQARVRLNQPRLQARSWRVAASVSSRVSFSYRRRPHRVREINVVAAYRLPTGSGGDTCIPAPSHILMSYALLERLNSLAIPPLVGGGVGFLQPPAEKSRGTRLQSS